MLIANAGAGKVQGCYVAANGKLMFNSHASASTDSAAREKLVCKKCNEYVKLDKPTGKQCKDFGYNR